MLLTVRDAKKNETDSSLDQQAPKKEADTVPHKPTSVRPYSSAPDLSNASLVSCSRLELSEPISTVKEAKSAVNIFTVTGVSRAIYLPRGLSSGGSGGSLALWSLLCP